MKLTKTYVSIVVLTGLLIIKPASAGIPVIDPTNIAQSIQQVQKTIEQIAIQRDQLLKQVEQLDTLKKEFEELHKATEGFSDFFPDAIDKMHSFLPTDPSDIESLLNSGGGIDAIKNEIESIKNNFEAYTPAEIFKETTSKASNEYVSEGNFIFSQIAVNQNVYKKTQERKPMLDAYRENLKHADTPKKTMDLLARATIQNSFLLNEIISMQALKNQTDLQELNLRRNAEARSRVINTTASDIKLN